MSFIENILESLGLNEELNGQFSKITIIGEVAGYFENVKSIKKYSKEEIILLIKKQMVKISGEELTIKKYCEGDLAICGKIKSIVRE